eukprot:2386416-Amphidinium_carterae.1
MQQGVEVVEGQPLHQCLESQVLDRTTYKTGPSDQMCSKVTWAVSGAGTTVANACQGCVNDDWYAASCRKFTGTSMNAVVVTVMLQGGRT